MKIWLHVTSGSGLYIYIIFRIQTGWFRWEHQYITCTLVIVCMYTSSNAAKLLLMCILVQPLENCGWQILTTHESLNSLWEVKGTHNTKSIIYEQPSCNCYLMQTTVGNSQHFDSHSQTGQGTHFPSTYSSENTIVHILHSKSTRIFLLNTTLVSTLYMSLICPQPQTATPRLHFILKRCHLRTADPTIKKNNFPLIIIMCIPSLPSSSPQLPPDSYSSIIVHAQKSVNCSLL